MRSILYQLFYILILSIPTNGFSQEATPMQVCFWEVRGNITYTPTTTNTPTITVTHTPTATKTPTPTITPVTTLEITIPLPNLPKDAVPLVMRRIPAGSFMMGRYPGEQDSLSFEDPQHQVNIGYDFYMGKYEITQAQWQAVMETAPWAGKWGILEDPDSPATYMTWSALQGFITALNQLGQGTFRLPSEAEWEYACRAGTTTRYYWGDDLSSLQIDNYAWWNGNTRAVGENYGHVVGQKLPNDFGLFDMSGNVWEWCTDNWHNDYTGAPTDGSAWVQSQQDSSVLRSGSWYCYYSHEYRSALRRWNPTSGGDYSFGFRIVRETD